MRLTKLRRVPNFPLSSYHLQHRRELLPTRRGRRLPHNGLEALVAMERVEVGLRGNLSTRELVSDHVAKQRERFVPFAESRQDPCQIVFSEHESDGSRT